MALIDRIDHVAKGRGYSIAQAKKIDGRTGEVTYFISKPKLKPWDFVGWAWYLAHKRLLISQRSN